MALIYVRANPGRVAYEEPGGRLIPVDRFVPVRPTRYIARLANVHGDIEIRSEAPKPAKAAHVEREAEKSADEKK